MSFDCEVTLPPRDIFECLCSEGVVDRVVFLSIWAMFRFWMVCYMSGPLRPQGKGPTRAHRDRGPAPSEHKHSKMSVEGRVTPESKDMIIKCP